MCKLQRNGKIRYISFHIVLIFLFSAILISCSEQKNSLTTQTSFYSMGSYVSIDSDKPFDSELAAMILDNAEKQISHRISDSLISRANSGDTVQLNSYLYSTLEMCDKVCLDTEGIFNINILPLTSIWDFDSAQNNTVIPDENEITTAVEQIQNGKIILKNQTLSVKGGIDFGAVGKGYACDLLINFLKENNCNGIVSVGGSIGIYGKKSNGSKRIIGIRDPFSNDPNSICALITAEDCFISTSGSYEKYIEYDGVRYHHILNSKTGYPVENELISVTIVSKNGAVSDALSTACFSVGIEKSAELCRKWDSEAFFVTADGKYYATSGLSELINMTGERKVIFNDSPA